MKLTDARKYKKQIKRLYTSAFPAEERAPLWMLYHKTGNGRDAFYAVLDENEFVGLLYTIKSEKMVYTFFLAVEETKRGQGYGSRILRMVKKLYPDSVLTLMIEDTSNPNVDNYQERLDRLRFYEANGYKQLHIKVNEVGVDYELLGTAENVTQADFLALMKSYMGPLLFKFIYRKTEIV